MGWVIGVLLLACVCVIGSAVDENRPQYQREKLFLIGAGLAIVTIVLFAVAQLNGWLS